LREAQAFVAWDGDTPVRRSACSVSSPIVLAPPLPTSFDRPDLETAGFVGWRKWDVRTGDPDDWLGKVEDALASAGFTKIRADRDACVCSGNFHKGTVWGELAVELDDASPGQTRLSLSATAAKDNIWTLLKGDPTERIIDRFVRCLPPAESSPAASLSSVAGELERLSQLHEQGRLSDGEFQAAKRKALS
jgi:hypothetical protein